MSPLLRYPRTWREGDFVVTDYGPPPPYSDTLPEARLDYHYDPPPSSKKGNVTVTDDTKTTTETTTETPAPKPEPEPTPPPEPTTTTTTTTEDAAPSS